jgi:Cu2+-exporting ATPase
MSCCQAGLGLAKDIKGQTPDHALSGETLDLLVPDVHCAGCIGAVEGAVTDLAGVAGVRLNLSTRRLAVKAGDNVDVDAVIQAVENAGYACRVFDPADAGVTIEDQTGRELLRALAIAGFAAANVMLLSISIWSGAEAATRDMFHWLSAMIALPAIAFAGRPFFRSAIRVLAKRRLNMDVPISLAVLLAAGLSLKVTLEGGDATFFDAAVMLLFFLLIGRYLDHRVRARAREAVTCLLSLWPRKAMRYGPNGLQETPIEAVQAGDLILVAAGARVPVDGDVTSGVVEMDCAALTGESAPRLVRPGDKVFAGAMALTGPITLRATAIGEESYLNQAIRLMEAAETGRAKHVRLADRAAQIYAPLVHGVALAAFLLQLAWTGGDWGYALWVAVSVLIITCPCALGLAVPAVQTVSNSVLFRAGVLVKDGSALERLAEIDYAAFDKTGTLTSGDMTVIGGDCDIETLKLAGALAAQSRHPLAQALSKHAGAGPALDVSGVDETPGGGIAGTVAGQAVRVGSFAFVTGTTVQDETVTQPYSEVWIQVDAMPAARLQFKDRLRPGAANAVAAFARMGFPTLLLSGDRVAAVNETAHALQFDTSEAELSPAQKIERLNDLRDAGQKPLMVGDGVNDGPALAAAYVAMTPASASDVGRAAADFVIVSESLDAIPLAHTVARRARRLILQNFMLAASYNIIAVPIAIAGFASPLSAAIAMSTSSLLVTGNALRLNWVRNRTTKAAPEPVRMEASA